MLLRISGHYPFQSFEPERVDLRYLSLGVGRQSTRLLLGILEGEFDPAPTVAIFADTHSEPLPVYQHLERILLLCEQSGFPVHVVSAGNIEEQMLNAKTERNGRAAGRFASAPLFTTSEAGEQMMMRRQCTREFKIEPVERKVRELLGIKPRQRVKYVVEAWQGIAYDEMQRMRENNNKWIYNRYPLIERRERTVDCIRFNEARGYAAVKSACRICPYHTDESWRELRDTSPADFEAAVQFDHSLRAEETDLGWHRPAYLHRSLVPLEEVDLYKDDSQLSLSFLDECEGICGV
jgi:hypothetical protein